MISIELTDTKDFMNKLLRTEIFDNFLLQEAVITKAASYVIDGHLQKGFYSSTELAIAYSPLGCFAQTALT